MDGYLPLNNDEAPEMYRTIGVTFLQKEKLTELART